jgi:hypothetical protein
MKFDFREASLNISSSDRSDVVLKIESAAQARNARQRLATALTENGVAGRNLARRIGACNLARPCRSAACPVCLRHFRVWWGSEIVAYMDNTIGPWFTVNVVPSDQSFPVGELNRFRWDHLKDRLRKQIARSQIHRAIILGGFDYSLQGFKDGRSPKWRPHMYFLTQTGGKKRIQNALLKHYPKDEDTQRPVRVMVQGTTSKDRIATATYSFKSFFYERRPKTDQRGNDDTEKLVLAPLHQAELALLLDRQGFLGRIIRYGDDSSLPLLRTR